MFDSHSNLPLMDQSKMNGKDGICTAQVFPVHMLILNHGVRQGCGFHGSTMFSPG